VCVDTYRESKVQLPTFLLPPSPPRGSNEAKVIEAEKFAKNQSALSLVRTRLVLAENKERRGRRTHYSTRSLWGSIFVCHTEKWPADTQLYEGRAHNEMVIGSN
jgi:hypothetical protein